MAGNACFVSKALAFVNVAGDLAGVSLWKRREGRLGFITKCVFW